MDERLKRLTELLEEIISDCYGDRYGIADFVDLPDASESIKNEADKLAAESEFYRNTLDRAAELLK